MTTLYSPQELAVYFMQKMLNLRESFRGCFSLHRKKAKKLNAEKKVTNREFARLDFATIQYATANFSESNMLGEEQFGNVYKGTLKSGENVCIKRLDWIAKKLDDRDEILLMDDDFSVVTRMQHKNLVKYLGFCLTRHQKFLVSEFMPNADLHSVLQDPTKRAQISWETWHKIILGIAKGMEYLHGSCRVLHCGLKASNVVLDEDMNPKLDDYGLSWFYQRALRFTNACSGSDRPFGYIAPEYLQTGRYTQKSDVYCFGVLVLETITGLSYWWHYNQPILNDSDHAKLRKLWEEDRLLELIMPELKGNCPEADVIRCIQIGILCLQIDAKHRPTMTEVILMLTGENSIPAPVIVHPQSP